MMVNGSAFMMGNIAPYIQSYFPSAMVQDVQSLFPIFSITGAFGNFVGSILVKSNRVHPRV